MKHMHSQTKNHVLLDIVCAFSLVLPIFMTLGAVTPNHAEAKTRVTPTTATFSIRARGIVELRLSSQKRFGARGVSVRVVWRKKLRVNGRLTKTIRKLTPSTNYILTFRMKRKSRRKSRRRYRDLLRSIQFRTQKSPVVAVAYQHKNYRGKSIKLRWGAQLYRLSKYRFNDKISSIKILKRGVVVTLYKHKNFRGSRVNIKRNIRHLRKWNDETSSIKVNYE